MDPKNGALTMARNNRIQTSPLSLTKVALVYIVMILLAAPALAAPTPRDQAANRNMSQNRVRTTRGVKRMVPPQKVAKPRKAGIFTRLFKRNKAAVKPVTAKASQGQTQIKKQEQPKKTTDAKSGRISWRETLAKAREEFQVYRGDRMERWANRIKVGRSEFNTKQTVKQNLDELVNKEGIEHYYAKVDGKDTLHVVVDLAKGKGTRDPLRSVLRRVGNQTIELNYKQATQKNVYGHVAVRVGDGALYDLTGSRGVAQLPKFMEKTLQAIRGTNSLTFARKRSLRRFMESRKDSPHASASVYFGMLFAAKPEEVKQTQKIYNKRINSVKAFNVSGGDASKGEYSCAQFLTEDVPFFNKRGVDKNIGAKGTASAARKSPELQAVVVYKMPTVKQDQLSQFP
mgnify:CR=1 FL=1